MSILPIVGGDVGNWGTKLNTYVTVEHNTDGTHKPKGYVTPGGLMYREPSTRAIPAIYSHIGTGTQTCLNYAKARGFVGISLNDFYNHLVGGGFLPPKPLILSFDDETTQWHDVIDPILATFGWRATGCISTGYPDGEVMTGGTDPFFYIGTQPLTWTQLQALGATGRWDWANHTRTHPDLTTLNTTQRNAEWSYSQGRIQTMLGVTPTIFVHPRDADNGATVHDAFAFGFKMVTVGPQGYAAPTNPLYGPGSQQMANPSFPNYTGGYVLWRDDPDALKSIEDVYEPFGNRIPDMPTSGTGDPLTVWTISGGSRGSSTNGVRFDTPQYSSGMDFRANGTSSTVLMTTSQYIAVKPGEIVRYSYLRQCGVSTGNFVTQVQEFDSYRASLRTNTVESLTGNVNVGANNPAEFNYTVGSDAYFVKLIVGMTNVSGLSGLFAVYQLPFFGSTR